MSLSDRIIALQQKLEEGAGTWPPETMASIHEEIFRAQHVIGLWHEFGDVPMDPDTECLESAWHGFPAGTHREDIWHWFEAEFGISVAKDLMNL